jgi:uncharacterized protein YjbI with pentapeptide repeats
MIADRMANAEHLQILSKGAGAWNEWRIVEPGIAPDLSRADLNSTILFRIDFNGVNLEHSDFSRAAIVDSDLRNANLAGAILRRTVLTDSRARAANLINADLHKADLTGTDFTEANFAGARFDSTRTARADFRSAIFGRTVFSNLDLSDAKNLASAIHWTPSTVGIDSIYNSKGKLPEAFLRDAGVPQGFVTFMQSLTEASLDFYSVSISYSARDQEFADRLHADLQSRASAVRIPMKWGTDSEGSGAASEQAALVTVMISEAPHFSQEFCE